MSMHITFRVHLRRIRVPRALLLNEKKIATNYVSCQLRSSCAATSEPESFEKIPGPKGRALWPVIGPAFLFKPFTSHSVSRTDLMVRDLHHKYGKIVKIRLPFGHTVLLRDLQDMLSVFHNEGKYPTRPNFDIVDHYMQSKKLKTLSTMKGEEWYHLRKRVQPKFLKPASADPYIPAIGHIADDLVSYVRRSDSGADEDLRNVIFMYILESLGQFCFDRRIGALTSEGIDHSNEIAIRTKELFSILVLPMAMKTYKLWKTKTYRKLESHFDFLIGCSVKEVERTISKLKDNKGNEKNSAHFIQSLLANSDLSQEEIAMTMSEFFFGGTDTTSKTLGILLLHIAQYPEQQQKLYEEIRDIIGNGEVTAEQLNKMNFTKACVKESMRLVFPLPLGPPRFLPHDLVLSGYKVPKGTLVMLSNVAYLHDPECVKNAENFQPQRWLRNEERQIEEPIPKVAFLPFGIGTRMCLGKRFAEQMLYLALIKLVQNFELRLKSDAKGIGIKYEVFPTTDGPLQIEFKPRHK